MPKPERSIYTAHDFLQWRETNSLELTPKFQRRGVWSAAARSYFVDTLLRSMPVPPIYIRMGQSQGTRPLREVIDGQQRISALLNFIDGKFRLSRTLTEGWAGKAYKELTPAEKRSILSYSFGTEIFHGISDLEVLEIFARLNTYSVPLSNQELRNGRFLGFLSRVCINLPMNISSFGDGMEFLQRET
jgi:uncharacterized protein with ParB-like and HNH nuclease domain